MIRKICDFLEKITTIDSNTIYLIIISIIIITVITLIRHILFKI